MFKKLNYKHNFNLSKFLKNRDLETIPKIFISSLGVILFFYIMPNFILYYQNESLEFKNNSKAVLAYTLKNDGKVLDTDDILDEKDLLRDIFSLNDLETDTVRLNASTIKQLFEDTDYSLEDVREKKLVKPVALTLLPAEIKMIENTKERKELFIQRRAHTIINVPGEGQAKQWTHYELMSGISPYTYVIWAPLHDLDDNGGVYYIDLDRSSQIMKEEEQTGVLNGKRVLNLMEHQKPTKLKLDSTLTKTF